jgi:hypothetical protein
MALRDRVMVKVLGQLRRSARGATIAGVAVGVLSLSPLASDSPAETSGGSAVRRPDSISVASGHAPTGTSYRLLAQPSSRGRDRSTHILFELRLRNSSLGVFGTERAVEPLGVRNSTFELAAGEIGSGRGTSGPFVFGLVRQRARSVRAVWADGTESTTRLGLLPRAWSKNRRAFVVPPNRASELPTSLVALDRAGRTVGTAISPTGSFPWING